MQVSVYDYCWDKDNRCEGTWLEVAKSTTIGQLKNMMIFDDGKIQCPPDSFSLRDYMSEKKLEDDVTVGSIAPYYSNDVRCLDFYSCSYHIQRGTASKDLEYKTFTTTNLGFLSKVFKTTYWCKVIDEELRKKHQGKVSSMKFPGETVEYL